MNLFRIARRRVAWAGCFLLTLLSGCASVNFDASLEQAQQLAVGFTQDRLTLVQTESQRTAAAQIAKELLQQPLSQSNAVRLALINSPALQALLAQNWVDAARAAQGGRIANPQFTFERIHSASELELGRLLSLGLLDVLTLPMRAGIAQGQIEQTRLRLAAQVISQVTQVRLAWVRAVAAQQGLLYAEQIFDLAQASMQLAQRMLVAGHFSRAQQLRQQVVFVQTQVQRDQAQQLASTTREALIQILGLTEEQVLQFKLPEQLPNSPSQPRPPDEVSQTIKTQRLDIAQAQAEYNAAAQAQGLTTLTSLTDIELGVRRNTVFDNTAGSKTAKNGYEVSVRLPLFDSGDQQRQAMNAQTLAAAYRLEAAVRAAGSQVRDSYASYLGAFEAAAHYRDEIVPLHKTLLDEELLRYNAMQMGVLDLLAQAREHVTNVQAALLALEQFWLADAALQTVLAGLPSVISRAGSTTDAAVGANRTGENHAAP